MTHYVDLLFASSRISVTLAAWVVIACGIVYFVRWRRNGHNYAKLNYDLMLAHMRNMESFTKQMHELWSLQVDEVSHHGQELQLQRDLVEELRRYRRRCEEAHEILKGMKK